MAAIKDALLNKVRRCIHSADTNYGRATVDNIAALEDIESDLKDALDAVTKLIAINIAERNAGL